MPVSKFELSIIIKTFNLSSRRPINMRQDELISSRDADYGQQEANMLRQLRKLLHGHERYCENNGSVLLCLGKTA